MVWRKLLVVTALLSVALPASAGIIFNRNKGKQSADQAAELVKALKNENDERRRAAAASELKKIDPKISPAIILALIDTLQTDSSPNVRFEAAQTLAKYRPVTAPVGEALELAAEHDPSPRVRQAVRPLLVQYHAAGYRSNARTPEAPKNEPPIASLAQPRPAPPAPTRPAAPPSRTATRANPGRETAEPPLALDPSVAGAEPPVAAPTNPVRPNDRISSAAKEKLPPRIIFDTEPPAKPLKPIAESKPPAKPVAKPATKPAEKEVEGPMLNPPG